MTHSVGRLRPGSAGGQSVHLADALGPGRAVSALWTCSVGAALISADCQTSSVIVFAQVGAKHARSFDLHPSACLSLECPGNIWDCCLEASYCLRVFSVLQRDSSCSLISEMPQH